MNHKKIAQRLNAITLITEQAFAGRYCAASSKVAAIKNLREIADMHTDFAASEIPLNEADEPVPYEFAESAEAGAKKPISTAANLILSVDDETDEVTITFDREEQIPAHLLAPLLTNASEIYQAVATGIMANIPQGKIVKLPVRVNKEGDANSINVSIETN